MKNPHGSRMTCEISSSDEINLFSISCSAQKLTNTDEKIKDLQLDLLILETAFLSFLTNESVRVLTNESYLKPFQQLLLLLAGNNCIQTMSEIREQS